MIKIGTNDVKAMSPDAVKSAFNAIPLDGLAVTVKHPGGVVANVTLKEGPIYPTFAQCGALE